MPLAPRAPKPRINDAGQIVGVFDTPPVSHQRLGFLYDDGTFTTIDAPGATSFTVAFGINNAGQIVGVFDNPQNGGFLYDDGTFTAVDVPGAATICFGINDAGRIVGEFNDNVTGIQGFLALQRPTTRSR
jgi:probable HAF family extracellular repeat protein